VNARRISRCSWPDVMDDRPPAPADLLFRYVFEERLAALFPRGSCVLDLGGEVGPHGLFLNARGVRVEGGSTAVGGRSGWDGAFFGLGAPAHRVLDSAAELQDRLRPGAAVLLSLPGPLVRDPLPRTLPGRDVRPASSPRPPGEGSVRLPRARDVRRSLGPAFRWRGGFALGVVVRSPRQPDWAERHPEGFGLLAAVEKLARRWPLFRALGIHVVMEGVRR